MAQSEDRQHDYADGQHGIPDQQGQQPFAQTLFTRGDSIVEPFNLRLEFKRVGLDLVNVGGEELQRIAVPGRRALACTLGGPDRKTLFCLSAATSYEELRLGKSSSRIDVVMVDTEGSGYP